MTELTDGSERMTKAKLSVRIAIAEPVHIEEMSTLIRLSGHKLSEGFYTAAQIAALNEYVFGVDTTLVSDRTYFVVYAEQRLVACGGWSKRRTLYGGDQRRIGAPELLNPEYEAARIRAFFVHPDFARRGIGMTLLRHCEAEARQHGFKQLELMATLPGVPLYRHAGYHELEVVSDSLPNGVEVPFIRMGKQLN